MDKLEFTIPKAAWLGLNTRYPADSLNVNVDQFTSGTVNVLTSAKGVITKRPGGVYYNDTALTTPPKDQYEAVFTSGERHLLAVEGGRLSYSSGDGLFSLVTSGYTSTGNFEFATYNNRIYFGNGVNPSQVYDIIADYGGVTYTVPKTRPIGVTTPTGTITFNADTSGGAVPAGAHTYQVTYVYYDSEESNGNAVSGVHTVSNPNNTVNLKTIPIGGYGVTARKIYRDDNDGNYLFVGALDDNTSTTFIDTAAVGTLPIPTNNNTPPNFSLVITHRDRLWMAGVADNPNRIYWSEAGLPDIWFDTNQILCNPRDPIVALAVYADRVIVFNRHSMGQILGSTAADFEYSEISPSVGCVDNRSIQVRTLRGVPTLVWLSDLDFYQFNGSSINSISEEISNQLQFNIQQSKQTKGKNIQTSDTDFSAGTSSPGINLVTNPGNITTRGYMKAGDTATLVANPEKEWDSQVEWEQATLRNCVATLDGTNTIKAITRHAPAYSTGTFNNTILSGSNLTMPVTAAFTGENFLDPNTTAGNSGSTGGTSSSLSSQWAHKFILTRAGTLTDATIRFNAVAPTSIVRIRVWADSAGTPGTLLYDNGNFVLFGPAALSVIVTSMGVSLPAGAFWLGYQQNSVTTANPVTVRSYTGGGTPSSTIRKRLPQSSGVWVEDATSEPGSTASAMSYTLTQSPVAGAGSWTGPAYDTFADFNSNATIFYSGTYPSGTTNIITVDGADNSLFTVGVISQSVTTQNPPFPLSVGTITNKRYWRIRVQLNTTDDRIAPIVTPPILAFPITNQPWISEVIDHTTDITTLDALSMVATVPGGTSATVTIATSANNITYTAFTAVGSATPQRYSKVRVFFTTDAANTVTPTVSSVLLQWSVSSTYISQVINTGAIPAGWELFQNSSTLNGGTLTFEMRTASSIPGLTGATFVPVTNGAFITADINQFAQWRATFTSSADSTPIVASVTVNWFIQGAGSIRVASLFYNKQYFLAAAEFGNDTNNIVFMYDELNTWKVLSGLNINTMGLFFNDAYYGSSLEGKFVKWLDPSVTTDQGLAIEMDMRSKAYSNELGDETKAKIVRQVVMKYINTGAAIYVQYSLDNGTTFIDMVDNETGLMYVQTDTSGALSAVGFSAISGLLSSGRTVMFRIYSNDIYPVEIHSYRARCFVSAREVLHG